MIPLDLAKTIDYAAHRMKSAESELEAMNDAGLLPFGAWEAVEELRDAATLWGLAFERRSSGRRTAHDDAAANDSEREGGGSDAPDCGDK